MQLDVGGGGYWGGCLMTLILWLEFLGNEGDQKRVKKIWKDSD